MNSKIIIVRIKKEFSNPIEYLEKSLKEHETYYYIVNKEDTENISDKCGLNCLVAFVIFESDETEQVDKVLKLFIGNGEISEDERGLIINYQICSKFTSEMIINNFVSNSELDLKNDFGNHSFVIIEDNAELVNQMAFISYPIYKTKLTPTQNQQYCELDKERCNHEFSQFNQHCIRPVGIIPSQENRSEFQRDYERIIHAKAYRRLVDKAQIFSSSKGDHYRTRMTHTLEVAQIARAIASSLNLNVELAESIALAHDLGHTPFGHQGERTLDDILKGKIDIIKYTPQEKNFYGGFKHNFQGVRVANFVEEKYIEFDGLDLSYQVLEGILKHTSVKIKNCQICNKVNCCDQNCYDLEAFLTQGNIQYLYPDYPFSTTLEGQIVAIADEIAQRSHDLDDAFASRTISVEQLYSYLMLEKTKRLNETLNNIKKELIKTKNQGRIFVSENELEHGRIVSSVIKYFISDVVCQSHQNINKFVLNDFYNSYHRFDEVLISFSQQGKVLCNYLDKIISKKVIACPEVVSFDNKGKMIVKELFKAYYNNPKLLHKGTLRKIYINMRQYTSNVIDFLEGDLNEVNKEIERIVNTDLETIENESIKNEYENKKKVLVRAIADYISGMTDSYAMNEYTKLFK